MYRYLTNEAVILMNRIIAESDFFMFRQFLSFSSFEFLCLLFQHLWDSENDISTSVLLSVVMPVHLVYAGTMVGAACARVDQDRYI